MHRLTETQAREAASRSRAYAERARSAPTWADLKRELGSALVVADAPDGTRTGRVEDHTRDRRHLRRLHEMTAEHRRKSVELGLMEQATMERVRFRGEDGTEDFADARVADAVLRKRVPRGARAMRGARGTGAPTLKHWFACGHYTETGAASCHWCGGEA